MPLAHQVHVQLPYFLNQGVSARTPSPARHTARGTTSPCTRPVGGTERKSMTRAQSQTACKGVAATAAAATQAAQQVRTNIVACVESSSRATAPSFPVEEEKGDPTPPSGRVAACASCS